MKKLIPFIITCFFIQVCTGQETIYPARDHKGSFYITNATIHTGNGNVINNGTIKITDGKIEKVGNETPGANAKVIDAKGKHVYPALISSISNLGLKEVGAGTRGSNDYNEIGSINPSIRSIVAYNTDSKIINILRAMGILLANIVPQEESSVSGNMITGSSTVVQLDGWNWEDAAYKMDGNMHLNMPSLLPRNNRFAAFAASQGPQVDPVKAALDRIDKIKSFFQEAKAYHAEQVHMAINLKFEAMQPLFDKKQKLFVHCNGVKEMLLAIDFVKEYGVDVVIVGGNESWQIANLLRLNNIPVILQQLHSLPRTIDDDVDQPFKTPYLLQQAGVLFALSDNDANTRGRNLVYNAGTAVSYGLTKEQALAAVTLNAAKILGIADKTGSIEAGKDANIVISEGDILDMRSSKVTKAFIQGRELDLNNKQTQLYERYKYKYNLK